MVRTPKTAKQQKKMYMQKVKSSQHHLKQKRGGLLPSEPCIIIIIIFIILRRNTAKKNAYRITAAEKYQNVRTFLFSITAGEFWWKWEPCTKLCRETIVSFNAQEVWVDGKSHLKRDELKCWLRSWGMKREPQHLVCGRCLTLCSQRRRCLALLQPVRPWFTQLHCCRVALGDLSAAAVSNILVVNTADMAQTCFRRRSLFWRDTWLCSSGVTLHLVYTAY